VKEVVLGNHFSVRQKWTGETPLSRIDAVISLRFCALKIGVAGEEECVVILMLQSPVAWMNAKNIGELLLAS
jgi:hypothetical protein